MQEAPYSQGSFDEEQEVKACIRVGEELLLALEGLVGPVQGALGGGGRSRR